ncbi:PREDICTED: tigger transposable element-derived protein 2-like [Habropoda laboriosa]|uniref:tigger transposable element-derived protein 2-like n=1 Tax=Habropoda laboriosa TaxID=597456 RepID=UPI00083CFDF5|nr:PREDICTED: tigger transposable element-derived protein 2-like [Habropoda laboriosa]
MAQNAANEFSKKLSNVILEGNLTPEQVYNLDETGINFKLLPDRMLATPQETTAAGFKTNKERITVAFCTNAAGSHKLPLFVIGKSAKPRAFKNININALPVYYKAQKSVWMNSFLFEEWFFFLLTHLKLPLKALLLDNVPSHRINLSTGDIKVIFLPPAVTSLVQPMDQGVIISLKRRYRKKLLTEILEIHNQETGLMEALKKINIKDVIYMLASAFEEMPLSTFVKSWRKLWPDVEKLTGQSNLEKKPCAEDLTDHSNIALLNDFNP